MRTCCLLRQDDVADRTRRGCGDGGEGCRHALDENSRRSNVASFIGLGERP
jgi:hypothetical protein